MPTIGVQQASLSVWDQCWTPTEVETPKAIRSDGRLRSPRPLPVSSLLIRGRLLTAAYVDRNSVTPMVSRFGKNIKRCEYKRSKARVDAHAFLPILPNDQEIFRSSYAQPHDSLYRHLLAQLLILATPKTSDLSRPLTGSPFEPRSLPAAALALPNLGPPLLWLPLCSVSN